MTKFTSLSGTTIRFTTRFAREKLARLSARLDRERARGFFVAPASTTILPRNFAVHLHHDLDLCLPPQAPARYCGQPAAPNRPRVPSISHISSQRCGAIGASISVNNSNTSLLRRRAHAFFQRLLRVNFVYQFHQSRNGAIEMPARFEIVRYALAATDAPYAGEPSLSRWHRRVRHAFGLHSAQTCGVFFD